MKDSIQTLIFFLFFIYCIYADAKVVILPENIVNSKNFLTQTMLTEPDVEYQIEHKYDLEGKAINLPKGSTLVFSKRGEIKNGVIFGDASDVKTNYKTVHFSNVLLSGTWKVKYIFSKWFDLGKNGESNRRNFQNMATLTSDGYEGNLYVAEGNYPVAFQKGKSSCFSLNSNTNLYLDGKIFLEPCKLDTYSIISIFKKEDVSISGKGSIIGDVVGHFGSSGEWGMGIWISYSKNIHVRDISVGNCWGDCIYI